MIPRGPFAPPWAAALAGCATLGGNVQGSFACSAPNGICAPTAAIDDRALAMIAGTAPAAAAPAVHPAAERTPTAAPAGLPTRTAEKVLRIVLPAWIDEEGRLHEASAVRAVVEAGRWQSATLLATTPAALGRADGADGDALASAIERADPPQVVRVDPDAPDPAVVAAARARVGAIARGKDGDAPRLAPLRPGRGAKPPARSAPARSTSAVPAEGPASASPVVRAPDFPAIAGEDR